ncbi:uncharacterized protein LOC125889084 [Epinephelus fuscoguttatus]|uniref:uncharacterized protein LOC125889084 n=1 Tax=Epinephelus fuscoguttatus TaxID=293821 RepID=UPI0020D08800|nr:uncharacterized protein LOC125889084 [Epinephelus fuscoguttatus]
MHPESNRESQISGNGAERRWCQPCIEQQTAVDIAVGELLFSCFSCLLSGSEDQASNAVSCFRVFNHDAWPENQIQLLNYSIEEVDVLLKHFGDILKKGGCNANKVQEEWQNLKVLVTSTFSDKNYLALWQTLLTKEPYKHDFENILHLVAIMLLLPISSAQCERGFSARNRIKNSVRSSLHVSTTEDLMRISTEGGPLETFDPTNSAIHWLSSSKRSRRPNYKEWPEFVSQV